MHPYPLPNVLPNVLESKRQSIPAAAVPWAVPFTSKAPAAVCSLWELRAVSECDVRAALCSAKVSN